MTETTTPPAPARPKVWLWLTPLLVLGAAFWGIFFWIMHDSVPPSGVELVYRLQVPEPQKQGLLQATLRRAQSIDPHYSARFEGDLLVLKLPGATPDSAGRAKRLFRTRGALELSAAAPRDIQERFNREKIVPDGYRVIQNLERARGGEYEAYGAQILVRKESVVEGRHIVSAEPHDEMTAGGKRWVTAFEMNEEGARLFDEAAEKLYNQRPPGLLAILLDGELKSCPAVQSPKFHGRGQISGAKDEQDARELAIILRSGPLPLPFGDPEAERPYGPK